MNSLLRRKQSSEPEIDHAAVKNVELKCKTFVVAGGAVFAPQIGRVLNVRIGTCRTCSALPHDPRWIARNGISDWSEIRTI